MIDETSCASDVADELELTESAYAEDVTGEVSLTSSAYGEDVAEAVNEMPVGDPDLTVMQYNIGHFNMGMYQGSRSYIGESYGIAIDYPQFFDYDTQHQRWIDRITGVNAHIIGMPEWNDYFGHTNGGIVKTKDMEGGADSGIFDDYKVSVGKSAAGDWWINTIASKYDFVVGSEDDIDLGSLSGANSAYVHHATITVNGKAVKIGVTHLNWARSATYVESRAVEIKNLIKLMNLWLESYDYVILFGDFNTDGSVIQSASKTEAEFLEGAEEFDPFIYGFDEVVNGVTTHVNGGFTLANHGRWGDMKTCDATGSRPDHLTDPLYGNNNPNTFYNKPFSVLDNIIVKGFTMSNVRVIDDGNITDHCAVVCDLTLIEND